MVAQIAATWGIAAVATGGVILRPWKLPEAVWAVAGAALLVVARIAALARRAARRRTRNRRVSVPDRHDAAGGTCARRRPVRLAGRSAGAAARGSATRLFTLVYLVGTIVTIFLSNDATAVVLTPAVAAVARTVRAQDPLPFLLICAFIANAASFVLPISNPANLVIYGSHMPPLLQWLPRYALPSLLSIVATYVALRFTQRSSLAQEIQREIETPVLSAGGKVAAAGIVLTAISSWLPLHLTGNSDCRPALPAC